MSRPALEVADIFRDHGPAWRRANAGHVSLDQMKVMSAIERCRTAALGGHVARCEGCAHTVIAYNSCRNRHCPKCQGRAARDWLAAREAELLPVPYYHVVFTLPAAVADIAYHNKAVIYGILFKAAAETLTTIAVDPKHLGAHIGFTSVLHTWGSALTHHPHLHVIVPGGGIALDGTRWISCRPGFFLPVRVLSRLFRRLFLEALVAAHAAGRLQFFSHHAPLADAQAFAAHLAPLRKTEWVVYSKRPFGGPQAVLAYLARYTHRVAILYPPGRHRQQPADRRRRDPRHLQVEGLSHPGSRSLQDHDTPHPRVHPTVPNARAAARLPPHPPWSLPSGLTRGACSPTAAASTTSPAPARCLASSRHRPSPPRARTTMHPCSLSPVRAAAGAWSSSRRSRQATSLVTDPGPIHRHEGSTTHDAVAPKRRPKRHTPFSPAHSRQRPSSLQSATSAPNRAA
jgi:hypothetical protein